MAGQTWVGLDGMASLYEQVAQKTLRPTSVSLFPSDHAYGLLGVPYDQLNKEEKTLSLAYK